MKNSQKGSTTVEGIIVISVVMLCVVAIIYIIILLYQLVYLQSTAYKGAVMGAVMVNGGGEDVVLGKITKSDLSNRGVYRHLSGLTEKQSADIESYVSGLFGLKNNALDFSASKNNHVVYSSLDLDAKEKQYLSAGGLLHAFGLSKNFTLATSVGTTINNPAEFIRNTDFLADTATEVKQKSEGKLKEVIEGKFKKAFVKVSGFFKKKKANDAARN